MANTAARERESCDEAWDIVSAQAAVTAVVCTRDHHSQEHNVQSKVLSEDCVCTESLHAITHGVSALAPVLSRKRSPSTMLHISRSRHVRIPDTRVQASLSAVVFALRPVLPKREPA